MLMPGSYAEGGTLLRSNYVASDWSTSERSSTSVDLHLQIDDPSGGRRTALAGALRDAIRSGQLRPGERLPSTRALAADLALARGTVTEAYSELIAEGWLIARQGSGTAVAARQEATNQRAPRRSSGRASEAPRHDLRPGSPDLSAFPRAAWSAALRRALRDVPDRRLGYSEPNGIAQLRGALASYAGRARGVRTTPEHIVICSGWAQGLSLLAAVMATTDRNTIGLEDPCIALYRDTISRAGLLSHAVPVDEMGADPSSLPTHGVGAVVLTPAHQYPMGTTLAPARRAAFVEWARSTDSIIIEDDYDGEFRYDRQPVGALQGLDPERVVYAGTASKSLAPGLRLAWLALPERLVDAVAETKRVADRHTSVLDQLAFAQLIEGGGFDRHLRAARTRYRRRRDLLVGALADRAPWLQPQGIAAGLHLLLPLPAGGPREAEVVAALAADGIAVHGLSAYWHHRGRRAGGLVVGYGTPSEHAYRAAVDAFTLTLRRVRAG
jgi:GntR family transcriptional regulator/MocR family aminotransferase